MPTRNLKPFRYSGTLDLSGNSISGPLGEQLASLEKLENLHLNDNDLTGGFPSQIGNLASLGKFVGMRLKFTRWCPFWSNVVSSKL